MCIRDRNAAHSKNAMGLHDVYEPLDPPYRREIPIFKPSAVSYTHLASVVTCLSCPVRVTMAPGTGSLLTAPTTLPFTVPAL